MISDPKHVNIFQMNNGSGTVKEILQDSRALIFCPQKMIPSPGQYLLAYTPGSDSPLADPVFFSESAPDGFIAVFDPNLKLQPGTQLTLRGPIGHRFEIPSSAKKIALTAFDDYPSRLRGLIPLGLKQNAEIVLVSDSQINDLPEVVEVQPLKALTEIMAWADYVAIDIARENLNQLREMLGEQNQLSTRNEPQVLVRSSMPCGGLAECGVCALANHQDWKMICKDGPVFNLREIF